MPQELIKAETITYRAKRIVEMEKDELIKVIQYLYSSIRRREERDIAKMETALDSMNKKQEH
jgi:hypothetical protein